MRVFFILVSLVLVKLLLNHLTIINKLKQSIACTYKVSELKDSKLNKKTLILSSVWIPFKSPLHEFHQRTSALVTESNKKVLKSAFLKKSYLLNDFNKKLNILTMLASVIPIYTGNMCEKKTPSSIFVLNPVFFVVLLLVMLNHVCILVVLTSGLASNLKLNLVYSMCTNIMLTITMKYFLRYGCKYMKTPILHLLNHYTLITKKKKKPDRSIAI